MLGERTVYNEGHRGQGLPAACPADIVRLGRIYLHLSKGCLQSQGQKQQRTLETIIPSPFIKPLRERCSREGRDQPRVTC